MQIRTIHFEYTTGCNSRCIMCDYWKDQTPTHLNNRTVLSVVKDLVPRGLKKVYFTGGECLIRANDLFNVCQEIHKEYPFIELVLNTNGILIGKYHREIGGLFSKVIVSLDTVDSVIYKSIRGVEALDTIQNGIRLLRRNYPCIKVNVRSLVLDDNLDCIIDLIDYAISEKLHHVSFIPVDNDNNFAFGRNNDHLVPSHFDRQNLDVLRNVIDIIKREYSDSFNDLLPNHCEDLDYIYSLYSGAYCVTRKCSKALDSCVVSASGRIDPCYFIHGCSSVERDVSIVEILSSEEYRRVIHNIAGGHASECLRCVCPKELS